MFGALMKGIAQDFVRYIMHVQVLREAEPTTVVQNLQQSSAETELESGFSAAARVEAGDAGMPAPAGGGAVATAPAKQQTVVNDAWAKTPRNAPCPCGSGKKFKMCHGR